MHRIFFFLLNISFLILLGLEYHQSNSRLRALFPPSSSEQGRTNQRVLILQIRVSERLDFLSSCMLASSRS